MNSREYLQFFIHYPFARTRSGNLRILWHLLGWFSFLNVLMFGMAMIPLMLIIALDGLVALMILDTVRPYRGRESRSPRLAESARWA
jgi:hypothetical protein